MHDAVMTPCGPVRGSQSKLPGVTAYRGIRYAIAERWKYPRVVTQWEGVYEAERYGSCAIQQRAYVPEASSGRAFYYREFRQDLRFEYSEDCLFLNIFAPRDAEDAPVIVYIHGGAFLGGSSDEKCFRDPVWPGLGVIAVTVNYRLGPFGFMCLPQLFDESGHTGNYGIFDQLAALEWISSNIRAFGGDPRNVTIMGQSAGAISVQCLASSPLTRGLIHRAVMSSGGGLGRVFGDQRDSEHFYPFWKTLMDRIGARTLEELRRTEPRGIMEAFGSLLSENFVANRAACSVVVDHVLLDQGIAEAAEMDRHLAIPYLLGSNSEDLEPVSMNLDAREWARRQKVRSYAYFFSRRLPGDEADAFHSADLWYWFGSLESCWRPFTDRDRDLSRAMTRYLANFARTGDPNEPGLPLWETAASTDRLMHFSDSGEKMEGISVTAAPDRVKGW